MLFSNIHLYVTSANRVIKTLKCVTLHTRLTFIEIHPKPARNLQMVSLLQQSKCQKFPPVTKLKCYLHISVFITRQLHFLCCFVLYQSKKKTVAHHHPFCSVIICFSDILRHLKLIRVLMQLHTRTFHSSVNTWSKVSSVVWITPQRPGSFPL